MVDGELYAKYRGVKDAKNPKMRIGKVLKEVLKSDKTLNYKIELKPHTFFGVPLLMLHFQVIQEVLVMGMS